MTRRQLPPSSLEQPADRRSARRSLSRSAVHLGLLGSAAAALGTLDLLHVRIAFHTDVGLVFVGLVIVHLAQRRRTIARMATQIVRAWTFVERRIRLAVSDLLLLFITLNVLVSGTAPSPSKRSRSGSRSCGRPSRSVRQRGCERPQDVLRSRTWRAIATGRCCAPVPGGPRRA